MIQEILVVDWENVRFKRALSGLVGILIAFSFISVVDTFVLFVIIATLFNIAAANDGPMSDRWRVMVRFSALGAIVGGLAFWSIDTAIAAAAVLGIVTYVGTLGAAFGQNEARSGLFLTLWTVLAMVMGNADSPPLTASAAFVIGGLLAIAITAARLALTSEDDADDVTASVSEVVAADVAPKGSVFGRFTLASHSEVGEFAVLRALAVVLSTLVGFWLFPTYTFWAPITVIIVVKPSSSQTASIAIQRTLGTAIGAVIAVMAVQAFPGNEAYSVLGFAVSAFFMVAFMNANYTLFAVFLTSVLVFSLRMVQVDTFDGGMDRLFATLVGALISFLTVAIASWIHARHLDRVP